MPGRQLVPSQDDARVLWIPDQAISPIPVGSIAYAQAELAAGIEGVQATASGAATALFDIDLSFEQASLTAGLGPQITDLVILYAVGVVALTAPPSAVLNGVVFGPAGAAAAAPVVTAQGGTISTVPATLPTATSGAGNAYTGQLLLANPYRLNTDLQKLVARLSVPMANTGTFNLLGVLVHFVNRSAQ